MSTHPVMGSPGWLGCWVVLVGLGCPQARADAGDVSAAAPFGQPVADDRVYVHGLLDEFEGRVGGGPEASFRWDGEVWAGTDTNRLWLKSEGVASDGRARDGDQELLYARPISPYFDLQTGVRYDLDSARGRGWAAVGVEGLTPYLFHLSATLYASDAGHFAAKVVASYDELLTQRWILQPLVELNAYTRADAEREIGAGLSDLDAGLRLRYEFSRKFAPYLGVIYERVRGAGPPSELSHDWRFAAGVRVWF
jgi:copper resistance protein B